MGLYKYLGNIYENYYRNIHRIVNIEDSITNLKISNEIQLETYF